MFKICLLIFAIILFCIFLWVSPAFRCALSHFPFVLYNGVRDYIIYILHKEYNVCPTGKLDIYTGLFGRGKTLSMVHTVTRLYDRYNNKLIYDRERGKFVTQKIHLISNVNLVGYPFERLESLQQIVNSFPIYHEADLKNDTLTVHIACIDELSVQMNSRSFKSNINADFLNTLLCCRHYHLSIFGTSQRFNHCDALLRQVTQTVIECRKTWRLQSQLIYNAYELENCTNVLTVMPLYKRCWFVFNKDYDKYNTFAVVENLKKSWELGDMLSDQEILDLQCYAPKDNVKENKKFGLQFPRKARA